MNKVAIAGVGLIGGSFALALRAAGFAGEIRGISSERTIRAAVARGVVERGTSLEEAAGWADLIYLAQPIQQIIGTLQTLGPLAAEECLITDAGSTKGCIDQEARRQVRRAAFLGGHPLAGKELRGVEHADPELFRGRPYVLTPATRKSRQENEFRGWLQRMGARSVEMTPAEHDSTVALTSHVPQLISTTLAAMLNRTQDPAVEQIFGTGLLDMTRLALSAPELWASILQTNKEAVLAALRLFQEELGRTVEDVEAGDVRRPFTAGSEFARRIRKSR